METFAAIEKLSSLQNLRVEDFEEGELNLSDILEEVNYLKAQITKIRQEMTTFLTGLASIGPNDKPRQVFEDNVKRVTILQKTLEDYVERFKKLAPLLELVNKELGVKVPERQVPSIQPLTATPTIPKKAPAKKKTYKKNSVSTGNSIGSGVGTPQLQPAPQGQFQGDFNASGTENQPIML